jgi:hypothetical protein
MKTMDFLHKGRTGFFPLAGSSSTYIQSSRPACDSNAMDIDALHESWSDSDDVQHINAFSKVKPAKHFTRCFNCGADGRLGKGCSRPSTKC